MTCLTVPTDWVIFINELTGPEQVTRNALKLKENLLLASNQYRRRIIDVGWYPEGKIYGEYCVLLVEQNDSDIHHLAYWSGAITYYKTWDINLLINKINELLLNVSEGT